MTMANARLAFVKLNVDEIDAALAFWRAAFGFEVAATFDEPDFLEHMLTLPGEEQGLSLMLVQPRPPRDVSVGPGHGPVGIVCTDMQVSFARAVEAGARVLLEPFAAGGATVAVLAAPQGHEIELVELVA